MRYHVYQFSDKTANFEYLGPNLPKTGYSDRNSKNLNLDSNQHPWGIMCTNFQKKGTTLNFRAQICPKIDFGVGISKIQFWIQNQQFHYIMCAIFQLEWTTLGFSTWIWGDCPITCNILVQIFSRVLQKAGLRKMDQDEGMCTVF